MGHRGESSSNATNARVQVIHDYIHIVVAHIIIISIIVPAEKAGPAGSYRWKARPWAQLHRLVGHWWA